MSETVPNLPPMETVACYGCGNTDAKHLTFAWDDLTGKPGTFDFVQCTDCGLVYQNPRVCPSRIRDYYDDEYLAHRQHARYGPLTWFYRYVMDSHDRRKLRLVSRYVDPGQVDRVFDIGCGAGTFLLHWHNRFGGEQIGIDFKDLSSLPAFKHVQFRYGLFHEIDFEPECAELITMWHFLEHDYDPVRTLGAARRALVFGGRLIIEVPRLDSATFRLFKERWPGLQAPQHTVLFTRESLLRTVRQSGFKVEEYLPYGAFPAYFYVFCGAAFKLLKGRGLNPSKAIYPYFLGQILLFPILLFEKKLNLGMQTVICRKV